MQLQCSADKGGPQCDVQGEVTLSSTGYVEWLQLFSFGVIPGTEFKKKKVFSDFKFSVLTVT